MRSKKVAVESGTLLSSQVEAITPGHEGEESLNWSAENYTTELDGFVLKVKRFTKQHRIPNGTGYKYESHLYFEWMVLTSDESRVVGHGYSASLDLASQVCRVVVRSAQGLPEPCFPSRGRGACGED